MTTGATIRSSAEFEEELGRYLFERSEEGRAVRVGEKEVSEQAAIVARYADLFSRDQLDALHAEEEKAGDDAERERLYRLRKTCEGGIVAAELAERADELENAILAARVEFKSETFPLRTALAKLAVLDDYGDRDRLGEIHREASAAFNQQRLELIRAYEELEAELSGEPDPVARSDEEKQISMRDLESVLVQASEDIEQSFIAMRERWFERVLGLQPRGRAELRTHELRPQAVPARVDVHEGARDRGLPRHPEAARFRPRGRPTHPPGPRGPAAEGAARLRDRVRPAAGRPPDHARDGRAPRLPGAAARGGARPALRRRRPGRCR